MLVIPGTYVFQLVFPVLMFIEGFSGAYALSGLLYSRYLCQGFQVYIRDLRLARDPPATGEVEPPF